MIRRSSPTRPGPGARYSRGPRPARITWRGRLWRLIRWPFWTLLTMVLAYQLYLLASIAWMGNNNPHATAFIKTERERLALARPAVPIRQIWVPYQSIAISVKQAVIAAEDSGFSQHDGVDWEAMERAARENFKKGKIRRGGSTITMQLAKNLFLSSERSYLRKAQELVITGMLEVTLNKRRILEIYLNVAEWGVGVFGIEAASRHYFGISAGEVSPEQAAWLASILPAPRRFDRNRESEWVREKSLVILDRMPRVALPK